MRNVTLGLAAAWALGFSAAVAPAQTAPEAQTTSPATAPPAETPEPAPPWRPPEGSTIINLPSADTNPAGTLQFNIGHRFSESVQSDTHSFFSFFSPAQVNLGLAYTPLRGVETGVLRGESLEDYELFGKWSLFAPTDGPFHAAVRAGVDWRTARTTSDDPLHDNRSSVFAQAILAVTIAHRVRITAVPTYLSRAPVTSADGFTTFYPRDVFNVPVAVTASITRSINVQGEIVPRREGASGVGWIAAVEKTVLRHRFSFTVGNIRAMTVDQYSVYNSIQLASSHKAYFGFNIVRLWKLN
ncbi:MAG TPA: DUF5777 family beta-barrel protein [Thermoanaerobaculia bacterium]|jgi:hypothetical protein